MWIVCGTLIGGVVGGVAGAILHITKANKTKKSFNVAKGMTYAQITAIFGEPVTKMSTHGGKRLNCVYHTTLDGKPYRVGAVFDENGVVKSIA